MSDLQNRGSIQGLTDYVGGICGSIEMTGNFASDYYTLILVNLINIGSINGNKYVGGLIGYCSTNTTASVLKDSSSKGVITGIAFIGGLGGSLNYLNVDNCSNAGTSFNCTSYYVDNYGNK